MNITIYKITSDKYDKCYVGSTEYPMMERFWFHKANYRKYCEGRNSYCSSFEIIDIDPECKIEELEKCSTINRKDRERFWIRSLNTVNQRRLKTREEKNAYQRYYRKKRKEQKELLKKQSLIKV